MSSATSETIERPALAELADRAAEALPAKVMGMLIQHEHLRGCARIYRNQIKRDYEKGNELLDYPEAKDEPEDDMGDMIYVGELHTGDGSTKEILKALKGKVIDSQKESPPPQTGEQGKTITIPPWLKTAAIGAALGAGGLGGGIAIGNWLSGPQVIEKTIPSDVVDTDTNSGLRFKE